MLTLEEVQELERARKINEAFLQAMEKVNPSPNGMPRIYNKTLKKPLKVFLGIARHSQDQWAEWLGISKSAFNKKLNGKLKWKELEKKEISNRLGIDIESIDFDKVI